MQKIILSTPFFGTGNRNVSTPRLATLERAPAPNPPLASEQRKNFMKAADTKSHFLLEAVQLNAAEELGGTFVPHYMCW
jgi:hypothetical protein